MPEQQKYPYSRTHAETLVQSGHSFPCAKPLVLIFESPLDLLSAVGDLRANSNASSVTISWTAPFSLDVTGVDPDIWYSVLIYNVTDENNPTAILCTDCINITETHYTFTPDYLSPCHVYNFSVIPVNAAGQGERNAYVSGYVLNCKIHSPLCLQSFDNIILFP